MKRQAFQRGEIRDSNDNIIQAGSYGKKSAFVTKDNQGILDYIINNFQALFDMVSGAFVYVDNYASLPETGLDNAFYVTKDDGKTYRWDGESWVLVSSSVDGLSAYEIAVNHGFEGSEDEWLQSLICQVVDAEVDDNGNLSFNFNNGVKVETPIQPIIDALKYRDEAANSASAAKTSETNAKTSETKAKASETAAKASENAAAESESNAQASEINAKASEDLAQAWAVSEGSPDNQSDSESPTGKTRSARSWALETIAAKKAAAVSEANAKVSETNAKASEAASANSASAAASSETHAASSETSVAQALAEIKVIQNSLESALSKVTGMAKYYGSVNNYSDLPTSGNKTGDVWNVVNADTEHEIKAGDNVIWNGTGWDNLSGFVDLSNYPTNADVSKAVVSVTYSNDKLTFIQKDGSRIDATVNNVRYATQATYDGYGRNIGTTYETASNANSAHQTINDEINNIVTGDTVVGKAYRDGLGNNIEQTYLKEYDAKSTYETISQANKLVKTVTESEGKVTVTTQGGSQNSFYTGLNLLQRNKSYAVGDIAYSPNLPSWAYLECVEAGTTGASEPDLQSSGGGY